MKFKLIFLSFNILIVFSFLMIFLMPVFMLGNEYGLQFWLDSWYIAVIFIIVLIFINALYFMNRRILGYLETENWPELKKLLGNYLFEKKKLRKMYVRLYISTCIATSNINEIRKVDELLSGENPRMRREWALQLGLPVLLEGDPVKMKKYFGEFLSAGTPDEGWIRWNYCFAMLLLKETDEPVRILTELSRLKKDPILQLTSLYMLSPFGSEEQVNAVLEPGRNELKNKMSRESFMKWSEKQQDNVQMLFLSNIINDALDWLYS